MRVWFVLLVAAGAGVGAAGALHCVCSSPGECEPLTEADCPRGSALVWDPCGCCRVCARLENEPCGGPDGFLGTCAKGLQCVAVNSKLDGVCKRPPERKSECGSRSRERTGCDIVEGKCACGSSAFCPGDLPPFTFENLAECEINLKSSSVGDGVGVGGWNPGGCQTATGETVAHGDHWWSEDRCMDCHCKLGQIECSAARCTSCINPHYIPGSCCPICNDSDIHLPHCKLLNECTLKCKHGLKKDKDDCFTCECHKIEGEECPLLCPEMGFQLDAKGVQLCECANHSQSAAPPPFHTSPRPCVDGLLLRLDGDQWYDGCRECVCRNGTHLCSLLGCPRCPGASYSLPGECCPRCNGSASEGPAACQSADGAVYPVGERWKLDECAWCECGEGGQVLCGQEPCPPAACEAPLPMADGCCPRCASVAHRPPPTATDACPAHRTEGESWRDGACTSCLCIKGVTACYEQKCPPPACPLPVSISGRCCPLCTNVSNSCVSDNNTYMPGDRWTRRGCEKCECKEDGQVVCSLSPECAPLNCQNSIIVPEKCCPTCPSELEGTSNNTVVWIVLGTVFVLAVAMSAVACVVWRGGGKWAYLQSWCCNSKVSNMKSPSPTLFYSPVKHQHQELGAHNGTPGEYMQVNTDNDSSRV